MIVRLAVLQGLIPCAAPICNVSQLVRGKRSGQSIGLEDVGCSSRKLACISNCDGAKEEELG